MRCRERAKDEKGVEWGRNIKLPGRGPPDSTKQERLNLKTTKRNASGRKGFHHTKSKIKPK